MRSINRPRRYSPARRPGCGSSEPNRRISTGRSKDSTISSIAAGGPARSSAASANRRSAERARPSRCVHRIAASAQVVNRISWARRIGSPCGKHDSGVNNRSMPKADQSRAHPRGACRFWRSTPPFEVHAFNVEDVAGALAALAGATDRNFTLAAKNDATALAPPILPQLVNQGPPQMNQKDHPA